MRRVRGDVFQETRIARCLLEVGNEFEPSGHFIFLYLKYVTKYFCASRDIPPKKRSKPEIYNEPLTMGFVGASILPHGAMVFDGDPNSDSTACRERNSTMPSDLIKDCSALYSSCERAADLVAEMNPEVVLLVTPHGISLSSGALGVYMTNVACGNALWNDTWQDIEVSVLLDVHLSGQLLDFVQKQGLKADGIVTFSMMEAPLRWGEVVPLWFVNRKVDSDKVKYIVLSVGRQRESFEVIGKALHDFASILHQRLVVVISGDLAHTHKMVYNIPLYLPGIYNFIILLKGWGDGGRVEWGRERSHLPDLPVSLLLVPTYHLFLCDTQVSRISPSSSPLSLDFILCFEFSVKLNVKAESILAYLGVISFNLPSINANSSVTVDTDCTNPLCVKYISSKIMQQCGWYSQKCWVGVYGPLSKTLTLFMTKIYHIPYHVYDLTKNSKPYL